MLKNLLIGISLIMSKLINETKIAVLGLGYVGLPLAIAFGKKFQTIGFDISKSKILAYNRKYDPNNEVSYEEFEKAILLNFTNDDKSLSNVDYIFVAVPTPIDEAKIPDLSLLKEATNLIAKNIKEGTTIVYEPTVYPGVTEDICVPLLEDISGLKWKNNSTLDTLLKELLKIKK